MSTLIRANVINRDIYIQDDPQTKEQPIIRCGNDDYTIEFNFDSEWDERNLKTARFVVVRDRETSHTDVVFSGNCVNVPVMSGVELVYVGVFAGDINATSKAAIKCVKSILCELPYPNPPSEDIYNQIMALFENVKGASVWVRYSDQPDGSNFTEIWHEGQTYIGLATALYTPTNKDDYVWTRLSQGPQGEKGEKGDRGEKSLIGSIETVDGRILNFFLGTKAEYEALPEDVKVNSLFAIITDEDDRESFDALIEGLVNDVDGMKDGKVTVEKANNAKKSETASTADTASDLSKTLTIEKGGTGATSVEEALSAFGLSHAAKIVTGTYIGTGTVGVDNPNTLVAPFEPKLVYVTLAKKYEVSKNTITSGYTERTTYPSRGNLMTSLLWVEGMSEVSLGSEGEKMRFHKEGNSFEWYVAGTTSDVYQLNEFYEVYYTVGDLHKKTECTYAYVMIG